MNTPNDRRRAPFLGLPVFEIFYAFLFVTSIVFSLIAPWVRWLLR